MLSEHQTQTSGLNFNTQQNSELHLSHEAWTLSSVTVIGGEA